MEYDAVILGATAEGVTAALTGAGVGMNVAIVDTDGLLDAHATAPGPLVLSLLRETLMEIRAAYRVLGKHLSKRQLRTVFSRVYAARRSEIVTTYRGEVRLELADNNVSVLSGRPHFRSPNEIALPGDVTARAPVILIATGSSPRQPECFPFDESVVCDVDSIVAQDRMPDSLVVIGADLIACEFSCMFAALGCAVTLVDRRLSLLRFIDADLREILHSWMQRSGVTVVLGESIDEVELRGTDAAPHAAVTLGSGRVEITERVLVAAGSIPASGDLGLDDIGVGRDACGFIAIGDRFETSVGNIYAAGGVVENIASTTMRIHQGRIAMLCAAGLEATGTSPTPTVIYTVPEIATVGLTEEACGLLDVPHVVGSSGLGRSLRSRLRGEEEGLIKLVVSTENHQLIGVHVVGNSASELVGLGAALLKREGTVEEIAGIGLSPQSLSEAYNRAALDALTKLGRPEPSVNAPVVEHSNRF